MPKLVGMLIDTMNGILAGCFALAWYLCIREEEKQQHSKRKSDYMSYVTFTHKRTQTCIHTRSLLFSRIIFAIRCCFAAGEPPFKCVYNLNLDIVESVVSENDA